MVRTQILDVFAGHMQISPTIIVGRLVACFLEERGSTVCCMLDFPANQIYQGINASILNFRHYRRLHGDVDISPDF